MGQSSTSANQASNQLDCLVKNQGKGVNSGAALPSDAEQLLEGCPRELADTLRKSGQLSALRSRPWLSTQGFRALLRELQMLPLRELSELFQESSRQEDCIFTPPTIVPWSSLDAEHVVSAGQVSRKPEAHPDKVWQWRQTGLQTIRKGKLGVVLLCGGVNFRLGIPDPPIGSSDFGLISGKSIIQIFCERIKRLVQVCRFHDGSPGKNVYATRSPSVPVFVMTSRITHRRVVQLFEEKNFFDLPPQDIIFVEQPIMPVLSNRGELLPQSPQGDFAQAPGGHGALLKALDSSPALEQMRDRGLECLHVVGTENLLARVCDPIFIGFCRELDVDCCAKVVERLDPQEDLELFAIRQNPVSTVLADVEEAACGLRVHDAVGDLPRAKTSSGSLQYFAGCIGTFFFSLPFLEEAKDRPVRCHRVPRIVPFLEFHCRRPEETLAVPTDIAPDSRSSSAPSKVFSESGSRDLKIKAGNRDLKVNGTDLTSQRILLHAVSELRSHQEDSTQSSREDTTGKNGAVDGEKAWRCEVDFDAVEKAAVVQIRRPQFGPLVFPGQNNTVSADAGEQIFGPLSCSLVVPAQENAYVLETSLLDYFIYSDRAVAFQVSRREEFAPIRSRHGAHSAEGAACSMSLLHRDWVLTAGGEFEKLRDPRAKFEISPLLSYEGESLRDFPGLQSVIRTPCHLASPGETASENFEDDDPSPEDASEVMDTRPFYLQEYPQRLRINQSHQPQFKKASEPKPKK